jgi:protein-ribulosamine 3-kinase
LRVAASSDVQRAVEQATGSTVTHVSSLGGSSWSSAYRYDIADGRRLFVKLGRGAGAETMFAGEAAGLRAMSATRTLRIPAVLHAGPVSDGAMIAMEHVELQSRVDQAQLGVLLAAMHTAVPSSSMAAAGHFGFDCDNTIGGTPQRNSWSTETGVKGWIQFFTDNRLAPQVRLTRDSVIQAYADKLIARLDGLFSDLDDIKPALLHGDLWSGNVHGTEDGTPCILDPACYYGHAEAEWGMSWCAGFTQAMYDAYHTVVPRPPLFSKRAELYRLYHYLNHLNLFGDGYRGNCIALLESLTR